MDVHLADLRSLGLTRVYVYVYIRIYTHMCMDVHLADLRSLLLVPDDILPLSCCPKPL